eukprot:378853_1
MIQYILWIWHVEKECKNQMEIIKKIVISTRMENVLNEKKKHENKNYNYHHQETDKDFCADNSYWIRVNNDADEGCTVAVNGGTEKKAGPASKQGDTFTFIINFKELQLECYRNYNSNNKTIDVFSCTISIT